MDSEMLMLTFWDGGPHQVEGHRNSAEASSLRIIQNFLYFEKINVKTKTEITKDRQLRPCFLKRGLQTSSLDDTLGLLEMQTLRPLGTVT